MSTEPCENCGTPVMVTARSADGRLVPWHQIGVDEGAGTGWVEHRPVDCAARRAAGRAA